MSDVLVGRLFFEMGRRMSVTARRHVSDLCLSMELPPNTWYRWWLETRMSSSPWDNVVLSPKTDAAFAEWVRGERMYSVKRVKSQIDELKITLSDSILTPGETLRREIRGVGPLVHFTLGRYLDCPQDVEWLRESAADELSAKPWLASVLEKYKEFLPTVETMENTRNRRCQRETKRTTS